MTDNTEVEAEPKSPAEAFEELRREVAFMRKAIVRMADDQRATPDYSETLGRMANGLTTASNSLGWLTERPIVTITIEQMAWEIGEAGNRARIADQQTIAEAAKALNKTNLDLSGWIATARKADDQEREVLRFSAISAGAAAILAIVLTIACFRLFPEHGAAWLLGKDRWDAGRRLMASANPDQWTAIQQAVELESDNHQAIVDCQKDAKRTGQDQRCRVVVKASSKR